MNLTDIKKSITELPRGEVLKIMDEVQHRRLFYKPKAHTGKKVQRLSTQGQELRELMKGMSQEEMTELLKEVK